MKMNDDAIAELYYKIIKSEMLKENSCFNPRISLIPKEYEKDFYNGISTLFANNKYSLKYNRKDQIFEWIDDTKKKIDVLCMEVSTYYEEFLDLSNRLDTIKKENCIEIIESMLIDFKDFIENAEFIKNAKTLKKNETKQLFFKRAKLKKEIERLCKHYKIDFKQLKEKLKNYDNALNYLQCQEINLSAEYQNENSKESTFTLPENKLEDCSLEYVNICKSIRFNKTIFLDYLNSLSDYIKNNFTYVKKEEKILKCQMIVNNRFKEFILKKLPSLINQFHSNVDQDVLKYSNKYFNSKNKLTKRYNTIPIFYLFMVYEDNNDNNIDLFWIRVKEYLNKKNYIEKFYIVNNIKNKEVKKITLDLILKIKEKSKKNSCSSLTNIHKKYLNDDISRSRLLEWVKKNVIVFRQQVKNKNKDNLKFVKILAELNDEQIIKCLSVIKEKKVDQGRWESKETIKKKIQALL